MKQINKKMNKALSAMVFSVLFVGSLGIVPLAYAQSAKVSTLPATNISTTDATLNGNNGESDAIGHSFWVSLFPFSTTTTTLPSGVYSTPDLGAIASSTAFSAQLSSVTGLPTIASSTQYYFVAWSNVNGTWHPGEIKSFTTDLSGVLSAEDFGVVDYDTGLGQLKGYTSGFGLSDATFASSTSVVVKLYSGTNTLLQTNTAIIPKFNADITGAQFSSPFDVSGTFDYETDGYWTNVRESQFGQSAPATKVVATVTLANGKVVTAENTNLVGDPISIYPFATPSNVTTLPATNVSSTTALLRGMSGTANATGHLFWVSLAPFNTSTSSSTSTPVVPSGVYTTVDLGAIASSTEFSATLTSAVNLPPVSASTTYYFAAWSRVDGVWHPGAVLNFTTSTSTDSANDAPLSVTSVDVIKAIATANGLFSDGWKYIFHITAPTIEKKLSMKFSNWLSTVGSSTIPVANNMRISSAQADNGGAPVLITSADTYATPELNMISDLNATTTGRQVDITVEVAIPANSVNGSYTTNYGVRSSI